MKKIQIDRAGSFERLRLVEAPTPEPRPGYALVRTHAVGVNFADCVVRMGLYPSAKEYVGWPITPGFEFSGVIEALGQPADMQTSEPEGVSTTESRLALGDEVFGVVRFGAYATHVEVPLEQLFRRPEQLSPEVAAAIPVAALTAWYALIRQGAVEPGYRVLVHSAAGGVGSALVQMARVLGCQVTAVVGSSDKVATAKGLGAHCVIDKSTQKLWTEARRAAPDGYDVICDANGVETLGGSYRALRPTGRLIIYGAHTMLTRGSGRPNWLKLAWDFLRTPRFDPLSLTNDNKSVMAFNLSYLFEESHVLRAAFSRVVEWYASGELALAELETFGLSEAAEAHAALQGGKTRGKLVLLSTR